MQPLHWVRLLAYSERPARAARPSRQTVYAPLDPEQAHERISMDITELQAKATIVAALIASRSVEIPSIPESGQWLDDPAAVRLRDLTDYLYQIIAAPSPGGN